MSYICVHYDSKEGTIYFPFSSYHRDKFISKVFSIGTVVFLNSFSK